MKKIHFLRKGIGKVIIILGILIIVNLNNIAKSQSYPDKPVKVALIYTVTTPELKEDVVREVKSQVGLDVELLTYEVPAVFNDILATGYVTAIPAAKMIGIYMQAVEDEADVILSICSTVADIAYAMQDAARYIGVPIVAVNDKMCREAVRQGNRIAVMATFPTAITPTRNTLLRVAREMGKQIEVKEVLVEGGFGLESEQLKVLMAKKLLKWLRI